MNKDNKDISYYCQFVVVKAYLKLEEPDIELGDKIDKCNKVRKECKKCKKELLFIDYILKNMNSSFTKSELLDFWLDTNRKDSKNSTKIKSYYCDYYKKF